MRAAILAVALGLGLGLSGCTTMPVSSVAPIAGNAPVGAQQAYFSDYPDRLFMAAGVVCDDPGQSVVRPSANEVRCESLPDPQTAAAIILQFDGTVENLPKFVISFAGRPTTQGYLVTADNYIRVPQRDGATQLIRFPDPEVSRDMARLLEAAGGRPL